MKSGEREDCTFAPHFTSQIPSTINSGLKQSKSGNIHFLATTLDKENFNSINGNKNFSCLKSTMK